VLRLGVISSLGFTAAAASVFMLITAPPGTQVWGLAGAGLFGTALGMVFLWDLYCARSARLVVDADGLHLRRAALFGRTFPWAELQPEDAQIVALNDAPALQPARRRIGLEIQGLTVGRFTLEQGTEALLFLTDRQRVLALPTTTDEGLLLLVSVADPTALLDALQARQ
jgi:hypothetical protein